MLKKEFGEKQKNLFVNAGFFGNKNVFEDLWRLSLYIFMHFLMFP
jgi:hypothetical protein